jgi:Uma2 family endonuclease
VKRTVEEYFTAGVERVWVVDPRTRTVLVHRTATDALTLGETDTLRGEGILDGFELAVASLFAE